MRFGLFYEHQLPRPWEERAEARLLTDALEQIELADRVGFDAVWEVEHHFLEEYSHSSAPEVFLGAASQRTSRVRLGHGIVPLPPAYNHPARVAERIATLDLLSGGRVEFGTGESSSQAEIGGFGVERNQKHSQWEEALDAVTRMLVEDPFAGYRGRWIEVPPRNVVPKPVQRPHPPLWMACSRREAIGLAARKGIGALSFSFVEPEDAKPWVDSYYEVLTSSECVPAGFAVNPNVAVVLPFMCHRDEETAIERGIDGAHFFGYSLAHYYVFGRHRPGHTNLWEEFQEHRRDFGFAREIVTPEGGPLAVNLLQQGLGSLRGAIGTPEQVAGLIERYQRAGVDQIIFVSQAGRNRHEHICESIELFAKEVLPAFAERTEEVEARKAERLAEACEKAVARREPPRTADPGYVITREDEPAPATPLVRTSSLGGERDRDRGEDGPRGATETGSPLASLRRKVETRAVALLRGRSDQQLDRIVASGPALRAIFRAMARAFDPAGAGGFSGEIQYVIETGPGPRLRPWTVSVDGDRARATPGRATDPAVTLRMGSRTLGRILTGQLEPARAWLEGKILIEGDVALAARLGQMFPRS